MPETQSTPRSAWVTGVTGFLGRHVARRLAGEGWRVVGFARAPTPPGFARDWGLAAVVGGPFGPAPLEAALAGHGAPELVFHAIGSGSVGLALADPVADFERTVATTVQVLEVLRRHAPAARLLYPSSAAVYGMAPPRPLAEDEPPAPLSCYGLHKLLVETLLGHAGTVHGVRACALRCFSVYGPGQRKLLLWELGRRLLAGERPITLSGTGDEVRDMITVEDAAAAVARLARLEDPPPLLNIGSGHAATVRELAEGLTAALGLDTPIRFTGEGRPGDPPHYLADMTRARALGVEPGSGLGQGLADYAAWLKTAL